MNCLEYLSNKYNLNGYSPDTYYYLFNSSPSHSEEECEALLAYAQARFG